MKSLGANVIFAIDVGSIDDNTPQGFGDSLRPARVIEARTYRQT
jgi:hypothetical protein